MKYPGKKSALVRAVLILWAMIAVLCVIDSEVMFGQVIKKWWPTKVPAGASFVGRQACVECHAGKVRTQQESSMARALEPVAQLQILSAHPRLTFRSGKYAYEITRKNNQSFYAVTDGANTLSVPVLYAFGQGKAGQTYVLQVNDTFYESRLSFYNDIQGLDYTLGVPHKEPGSLTEALGRPMSNDETLQCFSCHATGAVSGNQLHLDKLMPGISCEACHGPGGEHAAAGKAGQPNKDKIFNPGRLSGDEVTQELCAACHRGVEDVIVLPKQGGLSNVRFQPYRIFNSKCYSDDRRISCIGCHNPHEPLNQEAAFYDAKCLACHQAKQKTAVTPAVSDTRTAPACKVETKNCAECHMPKTDLPTSHFKFTDHRIRIARAGEPYPN